MAAIRSKRKKTQSFSDILLAHWRHVFFTAFVGLVALSYSLLQGGDVSFGVSPPASVDDAPPSDGASKEQAITPAPAAGNAAAGDDDRANADRIKSWRARVRKECESASTREDMAGVKRLISEQGFATPSLRREIDYASPESVVRRCKNVVVDFGSNVGDSIGKVIDGGLPGCDKWQLDPEADKKKSMAEPLFLQGEEKIAPGKWNGLSKYVRERLAEMDKKSKNAGGDPRGPEDYCMYGVEGNPVFTERLRKVEQYVMSLQPRPLLHLHVFTETVGAAKDGPTEIFLDTVNEDKNFWGSSIIASHRDVKEGAVAQSGGKTASKMVATPVQGMTLTSLMKRCLSAFAPEADEGDNDRLGGHLFVKIDIEGGEYQLMNEAFDSGVLCEYVKMGNSIDIIVEFHTENLIGKNADLRRYYAEVKQKLLDCGVNIKRLPGGWA